MSYKIQLLAFFLLVSSISFAKVYETKSSGAYTDSFTWMNNEAPPLQCHDTLIIKNFVELRNNLILNSGAYLKIDSIGRLCGHHTTLVASKAYLLCLGVLQLDSLQVFGGVVDIKGKGQGVFTESVILKVGGAKMTVSQGGRMAVGSWFECRNPQQDSKIDRLTKSALFSFYPNPVSENAHFTFKNSDLNQVLCIRDINGRLVYQTAIEAPVVWLNFAEFKNGIYFAQLVSNFQILESKVFLISH
ncbi:MAG: T9SS type A sorting domain-containing protein [bacterium]|nr:T9SS type A sorting domain-containing protein [bacterium]